MSVNQSMPKKKRSTSSKEPQKQISFYCSVEFSNTIHAEKVRRGITIQEMIVKALLEYFNRLPVEEIQAKEELFSKRLRRGEKVTVDDSPFFPEQRFVSLAHKYFQRMPKAKRQILEEFIVLDLKVYGSARIKQQKD